MSLIKTSMKFPCGYEYKMSIKSFFMHAKIKYNERDMPTCPIHGKDCKVKK